MYKILTSIITEGTYNFLNANNILPSEQKGSKKGSYDWKYQLLINKKFVENSQSCHMNLSTTWIDCKKAFNGDPHTWILKVLQMYKISPTIINFLATSIKEWKFNLYLNHSQFNTIKTIKKRQN